MQVWSEQNRDSNPERTEKEKNMVLDFIILEWKSMMTFCIWLNLLLDQVAVCVVREYMEYIL